MNLLKIFCNADDFCQNTQKEYESKIIGSEAPLIWPSQLSMSEVMTLIILYHHSGGYRNFKSFYTLYACKLLKKDFPNLVSYTRFVELMPLALLPLCAFLNTCQGECTGIAFVDSTKIVICHNKRINSNKVFKDLAQRGKSSMGYFFGFKLHLIINEQGEILACQITPGNVDDREPVPHMTKEIFGKLLGDKGYISKKLFEELFQRGLQLITPIKKNMKNKLMPMMDKILLRKRSIIETINDQLKNICNIDHTRHRKYYKFYGQYRFCSSCILP